MFYVMEEIMRSLQSFFGLSIVIQGEQSSNSRTWKKFNWAQINQVIKGALILSRSPEAQVFVNEISGHKRNTKH